MPADRIRIEIVGSESDSGHVRLSEFLEQLAAFEDALRHTERMLSGQRTTQIYYKVVDLSHASPAAVEIEPSAPIGKKPPVRPRRIVRSFVGQLERLKRARKPPKGMTLEHLESYSKLSTTLAKHVQRIDIKPKLVDQKYEGPKVVPIDRDFADQIDRLIGPDVISPGSVSGFLEQINVHGGYRFTIYPTVGPTRVRCDFPVAKLGKVSRAIDRFVTVIGDLKYKNWDHHPHAVAVKDIDIHEDDSDLPSMYDLRGVSPDATGEESSEEFVRSIRDESW